MIIYLVGVSCVGKTTIGKILAQYLGFEFYDLDEQIEIFFGKPIEHIQDDLFLLNEYREKTSVVLKQILNIEKNLIVASTPSGLRDYYLRVYKNVKKKRNVISINLTDAPENILKRLTFYDRNSRKLEIKLSEKEKKQYLKKIKKDFTLFKKSHLRADYQIEIHNIDLKDIPKLITDILIESNKFRELEEFKSLTVNKRHQNIAH